MLTAVPASAQAATWTVNTTADLAPPGCAGDGPCSVRQALSAAGPGDTISIPANPSHYVLTRGELSVSEPVSIVGGGVSGTVIDAGGASRVMSVSAPAGTTATISGLTLTGGAVDSSGPSQGGGGVLLESGSLSLTGVSVSGNSVTVDPASSDSGGGGILDVSAGTLTVTGSTVDGNSLTVSDPIGGSDGGSGLYAGAGSSLVVTGSTIAANVARIRATGGSNGGGGIYDASGSSTYLNDTLSANSLSVSPGAGNGGGAIFHAGAPGTISDATIAQNSSSAPGGGIFDSTSPYTVKNTIVAENGAGCAGPAGIVSAGFNLEGSSTCGMTMPSDLQNTDPMLGPLTANGGPTLTQALTPSSPAIDAGSCTDASGAPVSTDQRGVARPQPAGGRCDIGAFEYTPASPAPLIVGGSRPVVLGSTRAAFAGVVNPGGVPSRAWFQYGLDSRYRSGRPYAHSTRATQVPGGSYAPAAISAAVAGLVPAALYHVRLVVVSAAGIAFGPDQTFVTGVDRPPRPPVLGRYVDARPAGGLVRVRIGRTFVPLTEPRALRVGTEFDARQGTVVVSAAGATGTFSGAVFRVTQPAGGPLRGLATASLADGVLPGDPAYRSCRRRSPQTLQTLHANVSGRFRVSGRFSAAGAGHRGSPGQWATSDRCDGTLTSVRRGAVRVTNLRRHVTATVRAGRSYLARR
jgi:hypothetical protein